MAFLTKKYRINRNIPTIGVTGPDKGGGMAWFFTSLAVWLVGGRPVRITPSRPRTADGLQGLIVGGGADVDPATYQEENVVEEYLNQTIRKPHKNLWQKIKRTTRWLYYPALFLARKLLSRKSGFGLDRDRDHLEFQLIDQAIKKGLPLMGICRGSQLLNVYFKGTLYEDINTFYLEEPNPSSVFPVKKIHIKPGSKLARVLGTEKLKVNALHNQAVKETGEGMEIIARESNKVVQAIENQEQEFVIGVQWHPEYLPQRKQQRAIFKALVSHARAVKQQIEEKDMQEALSQPRAGQLQEMEKEEEKALQLQDANRE